MHIVFVTCELATANNSSGGLASFTANMARIFASNNHKVTILLSTVKEQKLEFDENIILETIFIKKILWNFFDRSARLCTFPKREDSPEVRRFLVNIYRSRQVKRKINEINKREKIDIIHYCNLGALAFSAGKKIPYVIRISSFAVMCQEARLPIMSDANVKYDVNKLSIKDKLVDYTLKKAKYVISPSNLLAEAGKQNLGIHVTVIESPFVLTRANWDYSLYNSILNNKKYIIHYGRLGYLKGTHIIAQIVNEIFQNYPDIYLVMVGGNEELLDKDGKTIKADEAVRKSAGKYSKRVIYLGALVRNQLYPLVENAELCLLPSRIDNLPNTCIEAMAMGKIVVGTMGASFEQLIDDRISGFLCERDNPKSYLKAVNEALNMGEEEKKQMISKAIERVDLLNPDVIYKKYLEFYQMVIDEWYDK